MTAGDNGGSGGSPPAGWYPDPTNPGHERLWTGERWIAWIRPIKAGRVEVSPAGWWPDVSHPGFERLWSGEMWTEEIRRAGETAVLEPGVTPPSAAGRPLRQVPRRTVTYHDDLPPDKLRRLGDLVCVALALVIAAQLAEIIADWVFIDVQTDLLHGRLPSIGHVESSIDAVHATRSITLILILVAALAFLTWFYRAYRNLPRAGMRELRFGPGWAIGGWFIPFFNLVRPKQVANDIWKASRSAATVGFERRDEVSLPGALNWWWGLWILCGVFLTLGDGAIADANSEAIYTATNLRGERTGVWFVQAGLVAGTIAAVLILLLVRRISRMQDEGFAAAPAATKTCPDCAELVKAEARVCRFCGYRFADPA